MARFARRLTAEQETDNVQLRARHARRYRWAWRLTWLLPVVGVIAIAIVSVRLHVGLRPARLSVGGLSTFGGLVLVAGAALLVGALLGFLFGVPKTLTEGSTTDGGMTTDVPQQEGVQPSDAAVQDERTGAAVPPRGTVTNAVRTGQGVAANTNLEQISDWLTKILVGVGLVQIGKAPAAFGRLTGNTARLLGTQTGATEIVGSLLLFYVTAGFLVSYLITRLVLTGAFMDVQQHLH